MVLVHPSFFGGGFYDNLSENYDFILKDPSSAAGLNIGMLDQVQIVQLKYNFWVVMVM